ncbi:alpha/beta fold hydrolase [Thalassotalea profundi]|uniref:3-oxoadipate enol-lactonase n=1 Tax=Thalassotalea profundi TaxID=2036687 RepID=A0ABQ3IHU4_9GAMM|nr:alpha/beta hydrolase [Thalassotalea profundi]GHE84992.1 3-oxoadipate enol-lactonase [Thalassotalea profundi]
MATLPSGVYVKGSGPAVVFLHSSLSTAKQWVPLINIIKDKFTCINIDILGYGNAEKVTDEANYNFDVEVTRIRHIIKTCIGDENYHLVGHSCGGAIALKVAFEAPQKLLSLSLYEPVAFHLLAQGSIERQEAFSFSEKIAGLSNENAAQVFTDFWNYDGFYLSLPSKVQEMMATDMQKVNLDFKGLTCEQYQLNDLSVITCSAVIYSGTQSPHLTQFLAKTIAEALPKGTLCELKAGHMGPIDKAELVLTKIAENIVSMN